MANVSEISNNLKQSITLPCGAVLKNRIVKSPMSDSLGDGSGNPTPAQIRLYERWAEGGVALSLVGEVQGDFRFPEKPGNLVIDEQSNKTLLTALTGRAKINAAHIWAQLGQAGALAHPPISQPKGPSALDIDGLQCAGLLLEEVRALPSMYAKTAKLAQSVGFSGVEIHAGHGFLLSQFLSPLFNRRVDGYGGEIKARARLILEIILAVREAVGTLFPIGIRLNSSDLLEGGLSEADSLVLIELLNQTSIDLIDISGGTYFPGAKSSSDSSGSGAYFLDFARQAKKLTNIPLMLTGGFKKRQQAIDAIAEGAVDLVGIGRALALDHELVKKWLSEAADNPVFPKFENTVPGGVTAWYTMRLTAIGEEVEDEFNLDLPTAVGLYDERDAKRCILWNKRFYAG